jgi:hypothetical protein
VDHSHRSDLIRRLFAIVLSVGFGGAVAAAPWVRENRLPLPSELEPLTLLAGGLILVIVSWERYHQAVKSDESPALFYLEVLLVLSYLMLLLLSKSWITFIVSLSVVYALYATWWIAMLVLRLRSSADVLPRLASTVLWLCFFLWLAVFSQTHPLRVWHAGVVATIAILLYRWNRTRRTVGSIVSVVTLTAIVFAIAP